MKVGDLVQVAWSDVIGVVAELLVRPYEGDWYRVHWFTPACPATTSPIEWRRSWLEVISKAQN